MVGVAISTLVAQMCPTLRAPPRQTQRADDTPHIRGRHITANLFPGTDRLLCVGPEYVADSEAESFSQGDAEEVKADGGHITSNPFRRTITER